MSWRDGKALVKLELDGKILGNKDITSLGSTRPLINCSWAFLNSIFLSEIKVIKYGFSEKLFPIKYIINAPFSKP